MRRYEGLVREIQLGAAWIACPPHAIPTPGRYLLAWDREDLAAPLAQPVFPMAIAQDAFLATPSLPTWQPGDQLQILGPLGRGFNIPVVIHRLALASLSDSPACLLPLVDIWLNRGAAIALFTDHLPRQFRLPDALEIYPLQEISQAVAWADFLAVDLERNQLSKIPQVLRLSPDIRLPCPAQVLVRAPMPCAGLGTCGVCSINSRQGWKLACADGPVFDLQELEW